MAKHLHELLKQDQEPFHLHNYIARTRNKPSLACFSSFQDSPDFHKSPIKHNPTAAVLHVPPKTAAGLLEAAIKIQKQSSKPKPKTKFAGLFFASILKKLKEKNTCPAAKDEKYEMGYSFSNNSRISSAGWSEEDKSIDMDTISSCTTSRSDFYSQDFVLPDESTFCLSPLSPFRFALHTTPSPACRTPEFLSPAASPCRHQEDNDQATDNLQKEEDEKDQCSPVSVLDLPFEDDEQDGRDEDEDDYDLECSYAIMQKAKLQLLEKLRRFERLAELEPIELERRMLQGYEDEDDVLDESEEQEEIDEYGLNADNLIGEIFSRSSPSHLEKVPGHMKRLVVDLIDEEKKNGTNNRNEVMINMVCKRLDSWKEVKSNTINMMVELDLRRELDGWKSYQEEVGNRAKEIELAIFELLVEEILEELASH